jgi:hypothetical protein
MTGEAMKQFYRLVGAIVFAIVLALGTAQAKSSGSSHHSTSSHSSSSHASSTRTATAKTKLPPGTHFIKRSCKTASCKAKHPGGTYMLPIKPKKNA